MAKRIVWSFSAQKARKDILAYWRARNKSIAYAKKLNHLFKESIKIIAEFPQVGRATDAPNVRIKIVKDYLIIYEESESQIEILTIWDTRQNPENLEKLLE